MINFFVFFTVGIFAGLIILCFLPQIQKYLPEIDLDEDLKKYQTKNNKNMNFENQNKVIDHEFVSKMSSVDKKLISEKQK